MCRRPVLDTEIDELSQRLSTGRPIKNLVGLETAVGPVGSTLEEAVTTAPLGYISWQEALFQ
jgi:hypothetical protein